MARFAHPRHRSQELAETNAAYDLVEANRNRCPLAQATAELLHTFITTLRGPRRERLEHLVWAIEDEAGEGRELSVNQVLEVLGRITGGNR